MKFLTFVISVLLTVTLVFLLDKSWVIGDNRLPPLGRFLDPFHGFWNNIKQKNYSGPASADIPGLRQKVTVVYDSILIPHVFAENDEDLYLAQGYITATHRLWQMEFQTHAAAGRVSEITGAGKSGVILNYDRTQRRLGMAYGAQNTLNEVMTDSITRMMVEKYTEGINAHIHSLRYGDLPFEYKLLDYEPEDWTTLKCALLLKNMAQTLCIGDKDVEMTNALTLFGKDVVDLLYPDHDLVGDPIVEKPGKWNFDPITLSGTPSALPEDLIKVEKTSHADPNMGSNNWAVSGSKTSTGSPILCGDPHLLLTLPSIWYAIQLHGPGINVMGASLPGTPNIIIGFNDSIAWSVTNAQRDLVDWFSIRYQNNKREKYLLDGHWLDTKKVIETFAVRGEPVVYDTVIYTTWGPVTFDRNFHAEKNQKDYAFRWIAHDRSNEFTTFYKLNRARNHTDYMKALDHFSAPAQNFIFASTSGDIAMRVQGKYPVRRKDEGKFVLDGTKRSNGWQAFIPNEQNVMDKNPVRAFVSSANQYPVDATYPYYITATHFEAYRNRRINQVLSENDHISVNDMMTLQKDNFNLKAKESLPVFLSYLDSARFSHDERQAYATLKSWDYYNNIDSDGASYYEAWWDNLMPLIWDELKRNDLALTRPTTFHTIKLIKENPDLSFFDIKGTTEKENAGDVIRKAFTLGAKEIVAWKSEHPSRQGNVHWADYKDSYITNLLRIEPMNIHFRYGGNHDIVNANSKTNGPSWRMIVSLEPSGVKAWATYPGGQSENPGSEHYTDMLDRWVKGEYFNLLFLHTPNQAITRLFYSTDLNPKNK